MRSIAGRIEKAPKAQLLAALEDEETMGVIWSSHGWVECKPPNTDCRRSESRVWSWGAPGAGDRIWVTEWEAKLADRKLYALWHLSCGGIDPGDKYHRYSRTCNRCGEEICTAPEPHDDTHQDGAVFPPPGPCQVCQNGYTAGTGIGFHGPGNPPPTLQTFDSSQGNLVRGTDGWFKAYKQAASGDEADAADQAAFKNALP